jgi:hypothetical protein
MPLIAGTEYRELIEATTSADIGKCEAPPSSRFF